MDAMIVHAKCARCLAGLCGHPDCDPPARGPARDAITDVAGTSCCGDCAPVLLELVLHPLTTVVVNPPVKVGELGAGGNRARFYPGGLV
jgi:hypothetical protein